MANVKLFIDSYLRSISEDFGVDVDKAFEIFSIAVILEKSFQEVFDDIVIGGSEDGGIDGIDFIEVDHYFYLYAFQCKNKPKLTQNELDKFKSNFAEIFTNGNAANRPNARGLSNKIQQYEQLTNDRYIVEPKLYYVYNGLKDDPKYRSNGNLEDQYHQISQGFEIWDATKLYNKIRSFASGKNNLKSVEYVFVPEADTSAISNDETVYNAMYSFTLGNVRAANFRIKANQLCELIELEIQTNGTDERLFSDNVRGFLRRRAKANKNMEATIDDPNNSIYFPVLNNGITIMCDKMVVPTRPQNKQFLISATNPVIVNGLQTSKILYKKYLERNKDLGIISVNVRLYRAEDNKLIDMITDATNTQTPINFRDKISNRDFNDWAKILFENKGIAYLTKRGELFTDKGARELGENVNSDTVLQAWYATFYEEPEVAKNSKAKVLESIYDGSAGNHPLKELFEGQKNSPVYGQMVVAYFITKKVKEAQRLLRNNQAFLLHADELLSYGIFKTLDEAALKLVYNNDTSTLDKAYQIAINHLSNAFKKVEKEYQTNEKLLSIPGYFKSAKSRIDYNREAGILETQVGLIDQLLQKRI